VATLLALQKLQSKVLMTVWRSKNSYATDYVLGKTAAWNMHKYLQTINGFSIDPVPRLPMFHTPIDEVRFSQSI
jgi:hypothetical protein